MTVLLAGDIGATKTILRLIESEPQKSVRHLPEQDLHTLQLGQPDADAPIAVIRAGTGLGQGFLTPLLCVLPN